MLWQLYILLTNLTTSHIMLQLNSMQKRFSISQKKLSSHFYTFHNTCPLKLLCSPPSPHTCQKIQNIVLHKARVLSPDVTIKHEEDFICLRARNQFTSCFSVSSLSWTRLFNSSTGFTLALGSSVFFISVQGHGRTQILLFQPSSNSNVDFYYYF